MTHTATPTPTDLFTATTQALTAGRWSQATKLLDDLARSSNVQSLWAPEGAPAGVLDRIELVNARAEDAAEGGVL